MSSVPFDKLFFSKTRDYLDVYLLKQAGYDVVGVTLRTWVGADGEDSRCCEIDDARATAQAIGIEYHVFNCVSAFNDKIINSFIDDYLHGLTPNPCVICNREIKWDRMLYYAGVLQADYVATGHYASIVQLENGRYTVCKALHSEKDQAYMLYRLSQEHRKSRYRCPDSLSSSKWPRCR